ncbi:MAG: branched chain amino acid aminotransferase, partial [Sphingobacteriales bacterium]
MHAVRLNKSAVRMSMPEVPEDLFLQAIHTIVDMEKAWIPPQAGSALYIRPFMFSSDAVIGVKPSESYKFLIILSPIGPYYAAPMKIYVEEKYTRAA